MKLGNGGNGPLWLLPRGETDSLRLFLHRKPNCRCGLQCRLRWFALAVWRNWLQVKNVNKAIR